ncbi:MAG: hypothetical protein IPJ14_17325 [Kineosporiaceae bacterium]|nr:hypothetical protein [Kineosporiaceae bacterium]
MKKPTDDQERTASIEPSESVTALDRHSVHPRRHRARHPRPRVEAGHVIGVNGEAPRAADDIGPEDDAKPVTEEDIATVACWRCGVDIQPIPASAVSVDGSCPDCALQQACQGLGHVWAPWTEMGPSLSGRWPSGRARYCRVCTHGEYDPPAA